MSRRIFKTDNSLLSMSALDKVFLQSAVIDWAL